MEARRTSACVRSKVGILPAALADLTSPSGGRGRRGLPESSIIGQLEGRCREIRDNQGATKENRMQGWSPNLGWNGVHA